MSAVDSRVIRVFPVLVALICPVLACGADETAEQDKALPPQQAVELASGLLPEEAARYMTAPPGFQLELAAGEPMVHQPIAMALDERGRVWVAEAYTYPIRAPEGEGRDKIIILEDTDQNGSLDQRTEFATGLNLVSGLEVGFGGVWVGAPPYLLFIPDRDGDDVPDGEPEVLLDGFGYEDTHETLNAFNWGPDGWLYGCHGVFTHSTVGKPGTAAEERTPLNAGIWRFHPLRHEFEVFAWGTSNPWGVDFNDRGQAFCTACVIPHLYHVIQGARYQRQAGSHFNAYVFDDIKTIADHLHYEGNIRDHAWWGSEPDVPDSTSKAGGGHAHCGAMIYLGGDWPEQYRNQLFFHNIHGNRVNNDLLVREGSGYVGQHGPDLLLANDRWFRGINLRYGPDGGVYLIDWYDPNACHRRTPEIWDRSNGRVYKLSYVANDDAAKGAGSKGAGSNVTDNVADLSNEQLVACLTRDNEWYARVARRILQSRQAGAEVQAGLERLLEQGPTTTIRLRALWTLHAVGQLSDERLRDLLDDQEEYVRAWAIQLELEDRAVSQETLTRLVELANQDSSPVVRLYLASALQRLPLRDRWDLASALARRSEDAGDHNLPLMIWYGVEPLVGLDAGRALALARESSLPLVRQFVIRRAAFETQGLEQVVDHLTQVDDASTQQMILGEVLQAFEGRVNLTMPAKWEAAYASLALEPRRRDAHVSADQRAVMDLADRVAVQLGDRRVFPQMRQFLTDSNAPLERRRQALQLLVDGRDEQAAPALHAALAEPQLRAAALRALASLDDPQTPAAVLGVFPKLTADERRDAIGTLVARPTYAAALLEAIQSEQVPRSEVHAYHVRQLLRFERPELVEKIEQVWGNVRETSADKRERIAALKTQLGPRRLAAANRSHGRLLFNTHCSSCHTLFGMGGKVGPDITGSNRRDMDYLLDNIVDPSAVLGKDYRMTVIETVDGRVVSGLVQKETESAVTLRTINDTIVIPLADVEHRQLASQSLMPERLLGTLGNDEIRDLIGYLQGAAQVPLRGPDAPIDAETGRVTAALEGESMEVLKVTAGSARRQPMGNFTKDRWSGVDQLWWGGAAPGDQLQLSLPVAEDGDYRLELVMTQARDYGVVQLSVDGRLLNGPIDLFNSPDVITTGVLTFEGLPLTAGKHTLTVEILGANPQAQPSYMFGLDYVRLLK